MRRLLSRKPVTVKCQRPSSSRTAQPFSRKASRQRRIGFQSLWVRRRYSCSSTPRLVRMASIRYSTLRSRGEISSYSSMMETLRETP